MCIRDRFGVYKGVNTEDVIEYLNKNKGRFYKILTTPESFKTVSYTHLHLHFIFFRFQLFYKLRIIWISAGTYFCQFAMQMNNVAASGEMCIRDRGGLSAAASPLRH